MFRFGGEEFWTTLYAWLCFCCLRKALVIVQEPHKKWKPGAWFSGATLPLRFQNGAPVCPRSPQQFSWCFGRQRIFSHFTELAGRQYLSYVLQPSAKKLLKDLDSDPLFWPDSFNKVAALKIIENVSPQQAARSGNEDLQQQRGTKRPRARKTLSFSEFTDYIIEHKCRCEKDLWLLARTLKTGGEDLLGNYLETKDANKMLQKALRGWHAEKLPSGMLQTGAKFGLEDFNIPEAVSTWMKEESLAKALILSGPGGCGKTEMASAILATFGNFYFVDKLDVVKTLNFTGCESLLLDDVSLGGLDVDDCKSWLDVIKPEIRKMQTRGCIFASPKPVAYSARTLRSSLFSQRKLDTSTMQTLSSAGLSGSQFKMIWKLLAVAVLFFLAVLVTLTALAMLFFLAVLVLLLAAWLPAMFLFRRGLWANEKH